MKEISTYSLQLFHIQYAFVKDLGRSHFIIPYQQSQNLEENKVSSVPMAASFLRSFVIMYQLRRNKKHYYRKVITETLFALKNNAYHSVQIVQNFTYFPKQYDMYYICCTLPC